MWKMVVLIKIPIIKKMKKIKKIWILIIILIIFVGKIISNKMEIIGVNFWKIKCKKIPILPKIIVMIIIKMTI